MYFTWCKTEGEFFAHKLDMVLVCGFKTSFQTNSGFNMVYSKETNEQFKI